MILLRLILGLIFVFSGGSKLRYPRIFAEILTGYELLPASMVTLVAVTLPMLELLAGLSLLLNYRRKGTCLVLAGLCLSFMVAVGWALAKGIDISCGCFVGSDVGTVSGWHLLGNGVMLVGLAALWRQATER